MKLPCYWCHTQLTLMDKFPSVGQCFHCEETFKVRTFTCFNKENVADMAHLYVNKVHITMKLKDQITVVANRQTEVHIIEIQGCPFTLENFDNKLKTYLLFS